MTNVSGHFYRDASNRLTYEVYDLESDSYVTTCSRIVNKFDLNTAGELIVGLDAVFQDYSDGRNVIALEWDIWSGFIVTAKTVDAEILVRSIAEFLAGV